MESEELIQLVYMHEELYNPMHKYYHDKNHKDKIWQFIGENLGAKAVDCRSRWVTLRDQYRKAMRKKLLKRNAYKGKWKLEDEMSFLMPYVKQKGGISLIDSVIGPENGDNQSSVNKNGQGSSQTASSSTSNRKCRLTLPKSTRSKAEFPKNEPVDLFCTTIGNTLKRFSPYYQNMAKMKIFKIVSEIELKQINDKSENKDQHNPFDSDSDY